MSIQKRSFLPEPTSSEYYDASTGFCTIEYFLAYKDRFRVVPTGDCAVPWPCSRYSFNGAEQVNKLAKSLEPAIKEIFQQCGLPYRQMRTARVVGWEEDRWENKNITLDIESMPPGTITGYDCRSGPVDVPEIPLAMNGGSVDNWKAAATAVQAVVNKAVPPGMKIGVEIRNRESIPHLSPVLSISLSLSAWKLTHLSTATLTYNDVSSSLPVHTPDHRALAKVQNIVVKKVRELCSDCLSHVSFNMQVRSSMRWNHYKPTIMVYVTPKTRRDWATIENQICEAIAEIELETDIHIEIVPSIPARMDPAAVHDLDNFPEVLQPGFSIGSHGSADAGTTGAFVFFQAAGQTERTLCFLTSYQTLRSGDPENMKMNDNLGIGLGNRDVKTSITIDSPAPIDLVATRKYQHRMMEGFEAGTRERERGEQVLSRVESGFAGGGNSIGNVIFASGFRKNSLGSRLDWALVRLKDTSANVKNTLPSPSNICSFQLKDRKRNDINYYPRPDDVVKGIGSLKIGEWVIKTGMSRTYSTTGVVNPLHSASRWGNEPSSEIEVVGHIGRGPFLRPGDEGAMVVNSKHEWVGIASTEQYITSSIDIVEDIRETTGGTITLI
jgi:hypothetical protein